MITDKIKKGLIATGIAALVSGCDIPGRVELAKRYYEGKVIIKLAREVRKGEGDYCKLEVVDGNGHLLAYSKTFCDGFFSAKLNTAEGEYDLREQGIRKK